MSTSLTIYVRQLGYAFDDLAEYITAAPGTSSTVVIANLVTALTTASATRYNGKWVYNCDTDSCRRVQTNGYARATGTLTVDPLWTAPSASQRIQITSLFPAREEAFAGDSSYRIIVNRALSRIVAPRRLAITIVPGQQAYSLAAYPWLDREERYGWPALPDGTPQPKILEPGPTGGIQIPADWRRPHLRLDGQSPYLELESPFVAGTVGTLTVNAMGPASSFIKVGSTWAESTVGLVNQTDEALPSTEDVIAIGKLIAFETLRARGASSASGNWDKDIADQRAIARRVRYYDRSLEIEEAPQASGAAA